MNNSEIELELMQRFGLEKTVYFCEMASIMYDMMHKDVMKRHHDNLELGLFKDDICDYNFDADWWKNKHVELKNRMNGPVQ